LFQHASEIHRAYVMILMRQRNSKMRRHWCWWRRWWRRRWR